MEGKIGDPYYLYGTWPTGILDGKTKKTIK